VTGITNATSVVGGVGSGFCALRSDQSVWCWGDNTYDQLGDNVSGGSSATPQQVLNLGSVASLSSIQGLGIASPQETYCAVTTGGAVDCWGSDVNHQAGTANGSREAQPATGAGSLAPPLT
jgi:alpha-tubulin suppressor-like RCC1 family protein